MDINDNIPIDKIVLDTTVLDHKQKKPKEAEIIFLEEVLNGEHSERTTENS